MIIDQVDLHCTLHGADKVYHLCLEAIDDGDNGYLVGFAYGRRGSTLNIGTKTQQPVDEKKARQIYNKQLTAQFAKGYVEARGVSGNVWGSPDLPDMGKESAVMAERKITTPKAQSGILPQLLNVVDDLTPYYADPEWCFQEKYDGENRMIITGSPARGINKKGHWVPLMPELIEDANRLIPDFLISGEAIGATLYAFDLLTHNGSDIKNKPYSERYSKMRLLLSMAQCRLIVPVKTAFTEAEKRALVAEVKARNGEGICAKRVDAVFTEGRPNSGGDQLKFKFWESTTCKVVANNLARSVALACFNGNTGIPVGNVTIPTNKAIPVVGAFVEVLYLYYYEGGSLYQPIYKEERLDDCDETDCSIHKLKRKAVVPA
jgi:bifunctional non-homologous end joining protein LigD